MQLPITSNRKFTIAKELYLHGYFHSTRKSLSDLILAILDFDFCAETIIKTVLIDSNIRLNRRNGGFKTFDELIRDLSLVFPNLAYITEIIALHKLRNDVQHNSNIPSKQEVSRHETTVKLFFDKVLEEIYDNTISFSDISLALFIESNHEKTILKEMEKSYTQGKYDDSVYYAKQVAIYHVLLLRLNMGVLNPQNFHNPWRFGGLQDLHDIGRVIEQIVERLNWTVDRLCLRDHYDEINNLVEGRLQDPDFRLFGRPIERAGNNHDEATRIRNIVYEFLTSTKDLIKINEVDVPFIYDFLITKEKMKNKDVFQVGFVSTLKINDAKITIRRIATKDEVEKKVKVESIVLDVPKVPGLHEIEVNSLEKNGRYEVYCIITNENNRYARATCSIVPE